MMPIPLMEKEKCHVTMNDYHETMNTNHDQLNKYGKYSKFSA